MQITDELTIRADVETVWSLTMDLERWPDLSPTMTSLERLDPGPLRVGSRVRIVQPRQRPRVWTVTELDAPHRFAWEARVGGVTMTAIHDLVAVDQGCRNTLTIDLPGARGRVLGLLAGRQLRAAIHTENAGFGAAAEAMAAADR